MSTRDDPGRAHQLGPGGGAEADRALGEDRDGVADLDAAVLRAGEARRHDVGAHQHFFVGEAVVDGGEVGHRVGDADVFGLAAVDGVAELPAADRLPAVLGAGAVLRAEAAEAGVATSPRG